MGALSFAAGTGLPSAAATGSQKPPKAIMVVEGPDVSALMEHNLTSEYGWSMTDASELTIRPK
jgi:hypothetical protein